MRDQVVPWRIMNEGVVQDEAVHIRSLDNGPGIPDGDLERPFDPFFTTRPQETEWGFPSAVPRGKRWAATRPSKTSTRRDPLFV
mgnify:CR=1 FL=1